MTMATPKTTSHNKQNANSPSFTHSMHANFKKIHNLTPFQCSQQAHNFIINEIKVATYTFTDPNVVTLCIFSFSFILFCLLLLLPSVVHCLLHLYAVGWIRFLRFSYLKSVYIVCCISFYLLLLFFVRHFWFFYNQVVKFVAIFFFYYRPS